MPKFQKGNKYAFDKKTAEELREITVRGGKASGEARSFNALLRQIGEEAASAATDMPRKEYVARRLYDLAARGNIKAMELIMKVTKELDESVTLNIQQPRDLTPEEAAALAKQLEKQY